MNVGPEGRNSRRYSDFQARYRRSVNIPQLDHELIRQRAGRSLFASKLMRRLRPANRRWLAIKGIAELRTLDYQSVRTEFEPRFDCFRNPDFTRIGALPDPRLTVKLLPVEPGLVAGVSWRHLLNGLSNGTLHV